MSFHYDHVFASPVFIYPSLGDPKFLCRETTPHFQPTGSCHPPFQTQDRHMFVLVLATVTNPRREQGSGQYDQSSLGMLAVLLGKEELSLGGSCWARRCWVLVVILPSWERSHRKGRGEKWRGAHCGSAGEPELSHAWIGHDWLTKSLKPIPETEPP